MLQSSLSIPTQQKLIDACTELVQAFRRAKLKGDMTDWTDINRAHALALGAITNVNSEVENAIILRHAPMQAKPQTEAPDSGCCNEIEREREDPWGSLGYQPRK